MRRQTYAQAMNKRIQLLLLILSALPVQAIAQSASIGDASIALPDVEEFTRSNEPSVLAFAQNGMTQDKRLLAVWISGDQKSGASSFFPENYRHAIAYDIRSLENARFGETEFLQAKKILSDEIKQWASMTAHKSPQEKQQLSDAIRSQGIDPDKEVLPIGLTSAAPIKAIDIFGGAFYQPLEDSEKKISFLLTQPILGTQSAKKPLRRLLVCANRLLLKGKIVQLNVFAEYTRPTDVSWTVNTCAKLADKIVSSN